MSETQRDTDGHQEHTRKLTPDDRHQLLAAERRRIVLDAIDDRRRPMNLEALASAVARREGDETDPQRVAVSLHHQHLPKMDALGVVEYDPDERLLRP